MQRSQKATILFEKTIQLISLFQCIVKDDFGEAGNFSELPSASYRRHRRTSSSVIISHVDDIFVSGARYLIVSCNSAADMA
jgi:hypothetical protein